MTAVIIIVLHLKTWSYLPVPVESLHFRQRDMVWQHYGCILHWVWHRLQAIYQSDLTHHAVSYSFKIILDTTQGTWGVMHIEQTHNIMYMQTEIREGQEFSPKIDFSPTPFNCCEFKL